MSAEVQMAMRIADRAVVADVETFGVRCGDSWDCRPMVDEREHGPWVIEMAREAIAYAVHRGLAVVDDPAEPYMLRLDRQRMEKLNVR